ncbi:zinc-binding protein A33-like isoform X2 [Chiloscyllium plagiosum]|uniref:zinc-binding protein A33-like isoform X2 n=1 Tax=Chiloscyllium plagiosum TaxID=36176 RepID=UPI001CB7B75A|nr:zinc-binding protein A33-like isoform X2 [Chiloscyllium plagiosum]
MGTAKELGDLTHELTCPICLEVFTDPVSLDCEHHYCRSCISQSWEKVTGDVSCPECRQVFSQKNIRPARTLSSVVEKFRKLKAKVTERENGSYCEEHEKKLKLFCEEEEEIICVDCWSSEHETHDVTTLKEASHKYKEAFQACLDLLDWEIKDMIENKEKQEAKMEELKDVKGFLTRCENRAKLPEETDVEMTMEIFGEPFQFFRVWKGMRRMIEPVPESLTLDPNTANDQLIISEDLRSVEHSNAEREEEDLPDTPERFDEYLYVLSSQGFTSGIHYWEVDLRNKIQWVVGVCGESSRRKGAFLPLTTEGYWVMSLFNENDYRASTVESTTISVEVKPWKLGVYLDYEGGELVFYNADNMSHLYTFSDTFVEKLFPIFSPCNNLTGKNGESLTLLTG